MVLPEKFLEELEALLGEEQKAFLLEMEKEPRRGVRLNPLKCTEETLRRSLPFALSPTPFSPLSFYAEKGERFGALPAHHAGMFYSQEPSAASAVTALSPKPGERVLPPCWQGRAFCGLTRWCGAGQTPCSPTWSAWGCATAWCPAASPSGCAKPSGDGLTGCW